MSARATEQIWYEAGLAFSCSQCGNCCSGPPGYVWVEQRDIEALALALRLTPAEFRNRHVRDVGERMSLYEKPDGDCEWLVRSADGKTHCGVYAARPAQCRTWPFWESNLRSQRTWRNAARTCPGIDRGPRHPLPIIRDALRSNAAAGLDL